MHKSIHNPTHMLGCSALLGRLQDYLAGRWPQAREGFEDLLHARTAPEGMPFEDPPTKTLLEFMESHGFVAPEGWAGVRELTEK